MLTGIRLIVRQLLQFHKEVPMRYYNLILAVIILTTVVYAFPQIPIGYWGEITNDSGGLLYDVSVKAISVNDVVLDEDTTDDKGRYYLTIPWDDPDTSEKEGVMEGEDLLFYVEDQYITTEIVREQGSDVRVDFIYSSQGEISKEESSSDILTSEFQDNSSNVSTDSSLEQLDIDSDVDNESLDSNLEMDTRHDSNLSGSTQSSSEFDGLNENKNILNRGLLYLVVGLIFIAIIFIFFSVKKRGFNK